MSDLLPLGYSDNQCFEWVEDMPRPRMSRAMQKEQLQQLYHAAGALPYRGEWDPITQQYVIKDERLRGMTMAEVAVIRDWDEAITKDGGRARERVMDRILGKPKQALETKSMHVSYSEYLQMEAEKELEFQRQQASRTVDAEWKEVTTSQDIPEDRLDDLLRGV